MDDTCIWRTDERTLCQTRDLTRVNYAEIAQDIGLFNSDNNYKSSHWHYTHSSHYQTTWPVSHISFVHCTLIRLQVR